MLNESLVLTVIAGVAFLNAALFIADWLQFRKQEIRASSQALELAENCQKTLKGAEPELANQVKFSPRVEIHRLGRFPWQRRICLVLGVNKIPVHKGDPLKITVKQCAQRYLELPDHRHLWVRIETHYIASAIDIPDFEWGETPASDSSATAPNPTH